MTRTQAMNFIKDLVTMRGIATDEIAVEAPAVYPTWKEDVEYVIGQRVLYNDILYKVLQDHTSQATWTPDESASLYTIVDEVHSGTVDSPIPYDGNMALENGKYYTQDNVVYLCNRDTGVPVYNALKDLVGLYVVVAS